LGYRPEDGHCFCIACPAVGSMIQTVVAGQTPGDKW
jgi:hypothetical protein